MKKLQLSLFMLLLSVASYAQPEPTLIRKIVGSGTNGRLADDQYGYSTAMSGDILVVGSHLQDYDSTGANSFGNAGAVYVYYKDQGGTDNWGLVKKIVGSGTNGRVISDYFGVSVSLSGNILVVCARAQNYDANGANALNDAGAAYVYYKDQGGSNNWGLVKKIVGSGTNGRLAGDQFGRSVSLSGNILVVGAYGQDYDATGADSVTNAGAAYVFYKDQGGTDNWGLVKKLVGSGTNGRISEDRFGWSVSLSGNILVVGAYVQDYDEAGANFFSGAGAAYIYYKDQGGADNWGLLKKIAGSGTNGRKGNDLFGQSVSLSGNILVVGAYGQDYDANGASGVGTAGAAYVYYKDQGGTDNWGLVKKITGSGTNGRLTADNFGNSVSISGNLLVVGAYQQDYDASGADSMANAGAAYVFYKDQGGVNNWGLVKKLAGSGTNGRVAGDNFGSSAAISGTLLVVGANLHDFDAVGADSIADAGAVYMYNFCHLSYSSSSWSPAAPTASSDTCMCVVADGSPVLPNGAEVHSLVTLSGATPGISSGETFTVLNSYTNNGTLSGDGTLLLGGTATQSIYGTGLSGNVTLDNANGATIIDSLRITGNVTLSNGTLTTGGRLVLLATGTGVYAQIAGSGSGTISGNITVQKKLSNTNAGWRQVGIPVNTNIGKLSGINLLGAGQATTPERNIYYWNAATQTGNNAYGWTAADTATDNHTKAYTIYGSNANNGRHTVTTNLSITGTYVTGKQSFTITASDDPSGGGDPNKTGWNLVPNPYASNLDVGVGSAFWSAAGMPSGYKAIHVWDQINNQYKGICSTGVTMLNYNNTQSTSSATVIAPFQAFWIKTAATTTFTLTNAMRTTSITGLGTFMKKDYPIVRVNMLDEKEQHDQAVVYLHSQGSVSFNGETDAYKLFSMDAGVPSIYINKASADPACIKAIPETTDSFEVALSTINKTSGKLRFFLDASQMGTGWDMFLKDTRTNTLTPINTGDTLRLDLPGTTEGVLYLVMKKRSTVTGVSEEPAANTLTVGGDGQQVHILATTTTWTESGYTLYDLSGREVKTGKVVLDNRKATVDIRNLPAGVYVLHLDEATGKAYKVIKN